ncbi:hypothetical protein VR41_09130 [Streptomyces sp. NRRL B-1568]|nr:hypothetical protein VR41_09130 [Streptomyces sp. NRRL B-1568]
MRTTRVLTGAALTIAAVGLAGGPALAGDFGRLELSPGMAQPGEMVTANTAACGHVGHGMGDASAVGGPASFELKPGPYKDVVVGQFKVPASAKPGTYGIGVKCDNGKEATGDLVVGKTMSSSSPSMMMSPSMSMPMKPPKGGMKTGVGGTSEDSGTTEIVAGAAVLATAAVGGVWFLRRRGSGSGA